MARKVFYSFHYEADNARASQVRNIGVVEGNPPASGNDWEQVKRGGDAAIQRWIDAQLAGRSCAVVLVGQHTAGRKWINYEISKAWSDNKGVVGIHIHNLKNFDGQQSLRGANPFAAPGVMPGWLSAAVKCYDPPEFDSKRVYAHIADRLDAWIEEAIAIRAKYR